MYLLEDDKIGKAKQNKEKKTPKDVSCLDSKSTYKIGTIFHISRITNLSKVSGKEYHL